MTAAQIRFATLWLDAKIISGAAGDRNRVENNVRDGVHIASLGGALLAVTSGLGGLRDHDHELRFAPRLPDRLSLQVGGESREWMLGPMSRMTLEDRLADRRLAALGSRCRSHDHAGLELRFVLRLC